eukprot:CAMPEP_0194495958 /NCGR_PEP_ID=MMETSP0253-20130528/13396_1 /TAXON_ID=2966 /ORGANISM="Noctiluca scintillans" /LENGTH=64 /DNA_ID=CAMNT_0039337295 /DNA_START=55 /DNA_END=246 /DNA_ORIENTATION=-
MFDELLGPGSYVAMGKLTALLNEAQAKLYRDGTKPRYPFAENLFMMIKQSTTQQRYANPVFVGS